MYSCIYSHVNKHNVLCDNQHSFSSKQSWETQLLGVLKMIMILLKHWILVSKLMIFFHAFRKCLIKLLIKGYTSYYIVELICWTGSKVLQGPSQSAASYLLCKIYTVLLNFTQMIFCCMLPSILVRTVSFYNLAFKFKHGLIKWQIQFYPSNFLYLTISNPSIIVTAYPTIWYRFLMQSI